jgi:hypothetical protein
VGGPAVDALGPIEASDGAARDWMPFLEALVASNFAPDVGRPARPAHPAPW